MFNNRIIVDSELFYKNPYNYIKSLYGSEIKNISYKVNDVIFPRNRIIVDISYDKLFKNSLKTIYVETKDLYSFNSQSGKYIFEIDASETSSENKKIPVCLIAPPSVIAKSKKLPVVIYPIINTDENDGTNGAFYSYIARVLKEPLHAYSTILTKKINEALDITDLEISNEEKLKDKKELYNEKETLDAYKKEILKFDLLRQINTIKIIKTFDETKNSSSTVGYILNFEILPDELIFGTIIIIDKRRSDLLFYYPNSSHEISREEIIFIKKFMKFDKTNLPE